MTNTNNLLCPQAFSLKNVINILYPLSCILTVQPPRNNLKVYPSQKECYTLLFLLLTI